MRRVRSRGAIAFSVHAGSSLAKGSQSGFQLPLARRRVRVGSGSIVRFDVHGGSVFSFSSRGLRLEAALGAGLRGLGLLADRTRTCARPARRTRRRAGRTRARRRARTCRPYLSESSPVRSGPPASPNRFWMSDRTDAAVARTPGCTTSITTAVIGPTLTAIIRPPARISANCALPGGKSCERRPHERGRQHGADRRDIQAGARDARRQAVRDDAPEHGADAADEHDEPGLESRLIGGEVVVTVEVASAATRRSSTA